MDQRQAGQSYVAQPPGWWDRHVVPRLIGFCCSQPAIMKQRTHVVPLAEGRVLELGCGGGANLGLYDRNRLESLSGIDPSPELLARARATARQQGLEVDFRAGMAEALPFDDGGFDSILCTFTLCSVADPAQVLREMRRVLKPGGKVLYLEHGRAPDAGPARWQDRVEPVWKRIAGGCHLTRPVTRAFRDSGFAIAGDGEKYMPKTPRFLGWVEWGEARPA
ncbi:MAG: class I SAM-dependent methyltransferase [Blastomonas sp.]